MLIMLVRNIWQYNFPHALKINDLRKFCIGIVDEIFVRNFDARVPQFFKHFEEDTGEV